MILSEWSKYFYTLILVVIEETPPPPHTIVKGYINAWFSVQWTAVSHFG